MVGNQEMSRRLGIKPEYTIAELAEAWGVEHSTAYRRLIDNGVKLIPTRPNGKRKWLVTLDALKEAMPDQFRSIMIAARIKGDV